MRLEQIGQLSNVMRVLFDKEYRAVSAILSEETILRNKLRQLESQVMQNRGVCAEDLQFQAVGAQFLWQGWTTQTHRQLNTELAQVMAKKLVVMDRVRVAFGRQQAIELIEKTERRIKKKNRDQCQNQTLLSLGQFDKSSI